MQTLLRFFGASCLGIAAGIVAMLLFHNSTITALIGSLIIAAALICSLHPNNHEPFELQ